MDTRTKSIVRLLLLCLGASSLAAFLKIGYGLHTSGLAFLADGVHSLFDSLSTVLGIYTIILASHPPDEKHPYGHAKFEVIGAVVLATFLLFAAFELGSMAQERLTNPEGFPPYSPWSVLIMVTTLVITLTISRIEAKAARKYNSPFLAADAFHNLSDVGTDLAVIVSIGASYFRIPYVDAIVAILIALYLVYLSIRLLIQNIHPLVDSRVLDPDEVKNIVNKVDGVLHCHAVRSRGQEHHHFLDLNIHLPGSISLEEAHDITHEVEDRLKAQFPGLADVVIHTEPHEHFPCSKHDPEK